MNMILMFENKFEMKITKELAELAFIICQCV